MMSQESSKAEAVFAKYDPKKSGLVPVKQLGIGLSYRSLPSA